MTAEISQEAMGVADVLERAADLLSPGGAWSQRRYARSADGYGVGSRSPEAVSWCVYGAIRRVAEDDDEALRAAKLTLSKSLSDVPLARWNDAPERTQAEVVTALRNAALKARAGEGSV